MWGLRGRFFVLLHIAAGVEEESIPSLEREHQLATHIRHEGETRLSEGRSDGDP